MLAGYDGGVTTPVVLLLSSLLPRTADTVVFDRAGCRITQTSTAAGASISSGLGKLSSNFGAAMPNDDASESCGPLGITGSSTDATLQPIQTGGPFDVIIIGGGPVIFPASCLPESAVLIIFHLLLGSPTVEFRIFSG